jgi:maltose O-acetyltransferase
LANLRPVKTALKVLWADLSGLPWNVVVNSLAASRLMPRLGRSLLYRLAGLRVSTIALNPKIYIKTRRLTVGRHTFINDECYIDNRAPVTIGEHCALAMGVMLVTSAHELGTSGARAGAVTDKPIVIEDGCWLGARVTALPGVTIHKGCVIASGAVVTQDCLPNGMYAGVPARRVKDLP